MEEEENISIPIVPIAAGIAVLWLLTSSDSKGSTYTPAAGETPTDFILKYWNEALLSQKATTIPALTTITQAGLESGWGKHAPRFNFFGIKDSANDNWTGDRQMLWTKEYVNGKWVDVQAWFRAYPSARAGFSDHGRFFLDNSRYHDALQYVNDNIKFVRAIAAAGYATDPNYADKMISAMKLVVQILQRHDLI